MPYMPLIEATLTIFLHGSAATRARSARRNHGAAARIMLKVPRSTTSHTASQVSSGHPVDHGVAGDAGGC